MSWSKEIQNKINRLNHVKRHLTHSFIGREKAVDLLTLAVLCQEHLLLIGPPGTAKTEIINQFTQLIDTKEFHYLLTRFTEPSELFGPLDLKAFQDGRYEIRTDGMLPKAQIVFLDEIFQGSSAILNSLLTLLNERTFNNGADRQRVPLISLVGASNLIPDDPWLKAFADRFALRLEVETLDDSQLPDLLEAAWEMELGKIKQASKTDSIGSSARLNAEIKLEDLIHLHGRLAEVNLSAIRDTYANLIRELRSEGIEISDRRAVKGLKLIAGAALLRSDSEAKLQDFWPVLHLWNRPEEAEVIKTVLQPKLLEAGIGTVDTQRPVEEIKRDIEVIRHQLTYLNSASATIRHLEELNKRRRELLNDHPGEEQFLDEINNLIHELLQTLNYVQS